MILEVQCLPSSQTATPHFISIPSCKTIPLLPSSMLNSKSGRWIGGVCVQMTGHEAPPREVSAWPYQSGGGELDWVTPVLVGEGRADPFPGPRPDVPMEAAFGAAQPCHGPSGPGVTLGCCRGRDSHPFDVPTRDRAYPAAADLLPKS